MPIVHVINDITMTGNTITGLSSSSQVMNRRFTGNLLMAEQAVPVHINITDACTAIYVMT
jgi:hypothetical protein